MSGHGKFTPYVHILSDESFAKPHGAKSNIIKLYLRNPADPFRQSRDRLQKNAKRKPPETGSFAMPHWLSGPIRVRTERAFIDKVAADASFSPL
jgi:hypothetical protein